MSLVEHRFRTSILPYDLPPGKRPIGCRHEGYSVDCSEAQSGRLWRHYRVPSGEMPEDVPIAFHAAPEALEHSAIFHARPSLWDDQHLSGEDSLRLHDYNVDDLLVSLSILWEKEAAELVMTRPESVQPSNRCWGLPPRGSEVDRR